MVLCSFGGRCLLSPPRGIRGEQVTPSGSGNFQKVEPPFRQPYVLRPFGKERERPSLYSACPGIPAEFQVGRASQETRGCVHRIPLGKGAPLLSFLKPWSRT